MFTIYIKKGIQKAKTISDDYDRGNIILDGDNVVVGNGEANGNFINNFDNWERLTDSEGYLDESFFSKFWE